MDLVAVAAGKAQIGADGIRYDISDSNAADVGRLVRYVKLTRFVTRQCGQRDSVVLRKSRDIFDDYVRTADSEVNAVGIADVEVSPVCRRHIVEAVAVAVLCTAVGFEIDVVNTSVAAEDIGHAPPALIGDSEAADLEAVDVGKEEGRVDPDDRSAVFACVALVQAVVLAAVDYSITCTDNADVALFICDGVIFVFVNI